MGIKSVHGRLQRPNLAVRALVAAVVPFALMSVVGLSAPASAVTRTSGGYLWGVDSVESAAANAATVAHDYGASPAFWGRYLSDCGSPCGGNITPAEISQDHADGINLLLLVADLTGSADQGSGNGTGDANAAVAAARSDGVPAGVAIFKDLEAGSPVDTAFIESWYATVAAAGYAPGFYENSYGGFPAAYCAAVSANSQFGNSYLYASENEPGPASSGPSSAPSFASAYFPNCPGRHAVWQYTEGDAGGVDEDQAAPTTPLWGPKGLVTFVPPAVPVLSLNPVTLGAGGGLVTIKAADADPVTSYTYSASPNLDGLASCSGGTCSIHVPANLSLHTILYGLSVVANGTGGSSAPGTLSLSVRDLIQTAQSQVPASVSGAVSGTQSQLSSSGGALSAGLSTSLGRLGL